MLTITVTYAQGCGSNVQSDTLKIKTHHMRTINDTTVACESYVWNNLTILQDTAIQQIYYSQRGCDSAILNNYIKIIDKSFTSMDTTICEGDSILVFNAWENSENTWTRILLSENGCDSTVTFNLTIKERPKVRLDGALNDTICIGETIQLHLFTAADNKAKFLFTGTNQLEYKLRQTTFPIVYEVSNDYYCSYTDSLIVYGKYCCNLNIPNAFTPNQDGLNDNFGIVGGLQSAEKFKLLIFNRWGELVFKTIQPQEHWNGQYKGRDADVGVYFYQLEYLCNGEEQTQNGEVHVLR